MREAVRKAVRRRADAGALAACAAFFALFFGWVWVNGVFVVGGDAFAYSLPLRAFAWGEIARGSLPLWTPHVMSGYPLLAMSQLAPGYPLTWGYLLLSPPAAEQLYVLAPYLLAPAFTYAYCRELGRGRLASLLAGLSFGYGGAMTNLLGVVGIMTNSVLWLPLMLVGVERSRSRPLAQSLLIAAFAYSMSVLTGLGQGFVIVGLVAGVYALFLSVFAAPRGASARARWRPLAVCAAAGALGVGVGAFQVLETMRAVRRSVRGILAYEQFVSASFPPRVALGSLLAPLYTERFADVTTYVSPLALALAAAAAAALRRGRARDPRVPFWLAIALVSFIFILGNQTPIYPLLYHVPVFNLFRVPSRHAFEWTFAVSVLAAYGWDALSDFFARRRRDSAARSSRWPDAAAATLLIAAAAVGLLWLRATGAGRFFEFRVRVRGEMAWASGLWYDGLPVSSYLAWKATFTLLTALLLWRAWMIEKERTRALLLSCALFAVCFVEPFVMVKNWWQTFAKPPGRFSRAAPVTAWMRAHAGDLERVYTRFELFADEFEPEPQVDPPNLTALHGLHNVAGYEPLIFMRYSRALGGVGLDTVSRQTGAPESASPFEARSRVLDLLGARFVAGRAPLSRAPVAGGASREGVSFSDADINLALEPGESIALYGAAAEADALALVTSMAGSAHVLEGEPVARVRAFAEDGGVIEFDLRAGRDTSEWAHERADVRASVRHSLAPVFDSAPADEAGSFRSHRYWTLRPLGRRARVERVEIANTSPRALLVLTKASLFDSSSSSSYLLGREQRDLLTRADPLRWRIVFERGDVFVLENSRALPRAWLVAEAEAVDGEEALRRITGRGAREFDPRRMALLEVRPDELPALPGGEVAPGAGARVAAYEPNRIVVETDSPSPAVLVLGEIFYPGWEASVDGEPRPVMLMNFLLRSVVVPAGRHTVEMRYRAPAARNGAIISALSLAALLALALRTRRRAK